jgi:hypothetical protein
LNAAGTGIKYSTYISGTGAAIFNNHGTPAAIAVDGSGFAFVGGNTDDPTFPMVNAFQSTIPALASSVPANFDHVNGIVFELAQDGASLVYSSFLGGADSQDSVVGIAVDPSDNAYVIGVNYIYPQGSGSLTSHFPTTGGVIWPVFSQGDSGAGTDNAFVAKIAPPAGGNATKSYATLIGSASAGGYTYPKAIAVDASGQRLRYRLLVRRNQPWRHRRHDVNHDQRRPR